MVWIMEFKVSLVVVASLIGNWVSAYYSDPDIVENKFEAPACAAQYQHLHGNATFMCLDDDEYPKYDVENAIFYHFHSVLAMFKDLTIETRQSVSNITTLREETYLCPSSIQYVKPVRAINSKGQWRVILNHLEARDQFISQSIRVELCQSRGQPCPKIPACYISSCVQKHSYQRLLVFNPEDYYLPFAVESFKIPTSCDCYTAESRELEAHVY